MTKASTPVGCPFCDRDAASFTLTKRRRPTFYCTTCKTRVFLNTYAALESMKRLCDIEDCAIVGEVGYEEI